MNQSDIVQHNNRAFMRATLDLHPGHMVNIISDDHENRPEDTRLGIVVGYVTGDISPWVVSELPSGILLRFNREHIWHVETSNASSNSLRSFHDTSTREAKPFFY